jgi:benzoyl-CoA-dihydrodiol lyase
LPKLNSYDLGVDIELNDAITELFEHPEVRNRGGGQRQGKKRSLLKANIFMLGVSSHVASTLQVHQRNPQWVGWKICRNTAAQFRHTMAPSGRLHWHWSGDEIILIDDRSSSVTSV